MAYRKTRLVVIWREDARLQYARLLEYLTQQFGRKTAEKVRRQINTSVNRLRTFPGICSVADDFDDVEIRRMVIDPSSIYYTVYSGHLIILAIVDNRMSPENIIRVVKSQI